MYSDVRYQGNLAYRSPFHKITYTDGFLPETEPAEGEDCLAVISGLPDTKDLGGLAVNCKADFFDTLMCYQMQTQLPLCANGTKFPKPE